MHLCIFLNTIIIPFNFRKIEIRKIFHTEDVAKFYTGPQGVVLWSTIIFNGVLHCYATSPQKKSFVPR